MNICQDAENESKKIHSTWGLVTLDFSTRIQKDKSSKGQATSWFLLTYQKTAVRQKVKSEIQTMFKFVGLHVSFLCPQKTDVIGAKENQQRERERGFQWRLPRLTNDQYSFANHNNFIKRWRYRWRKQTQPPVTNHIVSGRDLKMVKDGIQVGFGGH